jgi:tetratricopeptide (TPR) repeat protein
MAARNRAMNIDVARTWYHMGQEQLKSGDTTLAIESFRNAATNHHDNAEYPLVLAAALAGADHIDEARQILLRLRTSAPENGEINLSLARLSAKDGNIGESVRYYRNALFGVWPPDHIVDRRIKVRTELVQLLLSSGDASQALAELLILSSDIPDTEQAHNDVGRLFQMAGDSEHALAQFTLALRQNPRNADALGGAGQATFNLADYSKARRYLEGAVGNGNDSPELKELLETTKLVLSRDPLAAGTHTDERVRRLVADLDFATENLESCIRERGGDHGSLAVLEPLWTEMDQGRQSQLRPQELRRDPEGFTTGLSLIQRIELANEQICGQSSPLQKALLLIGRKHGIGEQ